MADPNYPNFGGARAIYPSRYMPYILLLLGTKFFRCFGIFVTYDLLKLVHIVQFLFIVKAGSALFLIFLQKPFSSGKKISKHQWFRIGRHAFFGSAINMMWLFGLTLCGPFRTLLLYEHSDLVVLAGASALFSSTGGPAKFRGAVFFLIAVMGLLLFDHDHHKENLSDYYNTHSNFIKILFHHVTTWTGLADHKGGVLVVFGTLCLHVGYNSAAKRLSLDIGGSKRLHALSTMVSAGLLAPWALFVSVTRESEVESWTSVGLPIFLVILVVFVIDYYVDSVCVNHLEMARTGRFSAMGTAVFGLLLSCVWNHPFISQVTTLGQGEQTTEHALSGGVVFSFVLFMFATHILTSPTKGSKGSLVGYSASGLPLYSFAGDALHKTSQSVLTIMKNMMRQILESSDSRRIFYFLCVNLFFTFVELIYGVWTNSLGLISDGFHMLFDCSALVMGLYAAVMSHWKATRIFSYGYDRVEILSGFVNGLFLLVIAFFVFTAAISRIFDPPDINTERLLAVSVLGLLVNLIGIFSFSHAHSHGGLSHGHGHGGSSHSGSAGSHAHGHGHGHSHGGHAHSQPQSCARSTNMQGVFLHVLADTLGSVGVIISTFLIENFGLKIADPLCSVFIAVLIFMSVLPLVKETSLILLLRTPQELQKDLGVALQKVLSVEGVLSFRDEHFWRHSSNVVCGTIHIQIKPEVSEQKVIAQVNSIFKDNGVNNITVQVEKQAFFQHMSGLGFSMDQMYEMARSMTSLNQQEASNFIKAI